MSMNFVGSKVILASTYVEGGGKEFKKVEHFNFIHM